MSTEGSLIAPASPKFAKSVHLQGDDLTAEQRQLLKDFEATFAGEEGAKHSPRSSTFLDGVKAFWDRMTS